MHEDIIRMMREAGEVKCDCCLPSYEETDIEGFEGFLERFAALVAAAEREACAKLCEDSLYCAAVIRSSDNKGIKWEVEP